MPNSTPPPTPPHPFHGTPCAPLGGPRPYFKNNKMHYPQCTKLNNLQILMHNKHSYFSLLCPELILVCSVFFCFWLHKTFCSCISRELVAGALVQFPMMFQQAATRLSALCMCHCLTGCVLYSAVWECPVSPMSYCTLTLSNKPANPSVQPAPSSDFYWPKRQKW